MLRIISSSRLRSATNPSVAAITATEANATIIGFLISFVTNPVFALFVLSAELDDDDPPEADSDEPDEPPEPLLLFGRRRAASVFYREYFALSPVSRCSRRVKGCRLHLHAAQVVGCLSERSAEAYGILLIGVFHI